MPLDQKTKDRILKGSENHYRDSEVGQSVIKTLRYGYIAGAEAEAERAAGLVECLNSIKAIGHPDERVLNLIVLTLTKYNNSK